MKNYRRIIIGVIACIVIAAGAYYLATVQMGSFYSFRSPLHDNPPEPGQPLGDPLTRRVVFVLIDALRNDTSHKSEVMPFLNELRDKGAWATVHSRTPSYSDTAWSALMIGAWPDINDGPAMNTPYETTPTWTQDNLFNAAHRYNLKTAVSGHYWWEKLIPQANVDISFYTKGEDEAADREVVDAAFPWLQNEDYQFVLIHLDMVDYAGHHQGGPVDPRWDAAATKTDDLLRKIASTLDLTQDTLLVVSDHGQIDQGGHGGHEPITLLEPLVMVGAGIRPGEYSDIQQVDIAPTVAVLLGLNIPASAQGIPQNDMLTLTEGQKAQIGSALLAQKEQLALAYLKAIGSSMTIPTDSVSIPTIIDTMESAKEARLTTEQIPRFVLAILITFIPAAVMIKKRSKTIAWLVGGALLYLLLFNFRYLILDHRTYSLSSIASASEFIGYTIITAVLAFLIAWLVASLGCNSFKTTPLKAAEASLGLIFITLYFLSLPILWSLSLNGLFGIFPSWTLPDVASAFMGVLSTIQILAVVMVGLILTGITAIVAYTYHKKELGSSHDAYANTAGELEQNEV